MSDEPVGNQASAQLLKAMGLRVTGPRLAVLSVLRDRPHATAEEVLRQVRERLGTLSHQGAYDVLSSLEEVGLVRRIEPRGHPSRYETRVGDNHHHVICVHCGAIADVDCAVGVMPCLEPSSPAGFTIEEAEVQFWGACPDCQGNGASAEP